MFLKRDFNPILLVSPNLEIPYEAVHWRTNTHIFKEDEYIINNENRATKTA